MEEKKAVVPRLGPQKNYDLIPAVPGGRAGPTITLGDRSETENLRPVFSDLGEFSDL